ncbi:Metallo-dependent phosphatase-like protein [Cokeromyces recurvatus]|uniref:Metallo-dependent phosphatase-like protein n=1 Tax=Cokeromyces recurvatus TaxID=90255 RepID=UPI00222045E3|nr:Metallo-dependent phosphatase-like protein [Cokeromyces recurvatus]KAI7907393.1 Metallo-dependent phosphatase-like protein [Cokeromyces recurvatus]
MRIRILISLITCYYFIALTVQQQQQTVLSEPEFAIQNEVLHSIFTSCSSCISLLQILKKISYMSEGFLIQTLTKACKKTGKVDDEVCEGVIREQAPIIRSILPSMTISGRDGHLLCAAVLNVCPYPEVEEWNVTFPKPKLDESILEYNYNSKKSIGQTFTVLHLSDWHIDPQYKSGAETMCDKPFCCRAEYTDFTNITKPASKWGEYSCDTPLALIKSLLEYIPTVEPNIEFGIMTGDVPPHEVWSTLPILKTKLIQDETYHLLHRYFDYSSSFQSALYPAIGNHEAAPTNNFPLWSSNLPNEAEKHFYDLKWLYKSLANSWSRWISSPLNNIETNMGSYTIRPVKGLKLISLNTNFCYTLNWWLYEHPMQKDPNGILSWLINELQDSEDRYERVWIIGHIAPGDNTCLHDYSNYYYQIVDRYAHVIAGQFFGHTHKDELTIFYGHNKRQIAKEAISVGYIAPSITPFLNLNPGFRIYKIDTKTFEVVDSITYIADLNQADTWSDGPNWHVEYSAREAFNSSRAKLISPTSPLSAEWWHNVTEDMESNQKTYEEYYKYSWKSSPLLDQNCLFNDECKKNIICGIRAGKSELRCDYEPDIFNSEREERYDDPEPHLCGLNLQSIRSK